MASGETVRVQFRNGMRIRVKDHGGRSDMNGLTGQVVRIKTRGDSAWIQSDTPLTDKQRSFPAADDRRDHFDIYSDECEEISARPSLPEEATCGICGVCESWHSRTGCGQWTPTLALPEEARPEPDELVEALMAERKAAQAYTLRLRQVIYAGDPKVRARADLEIDEMSLASVLEVERTKVEAILAARSAQPETGGNTHGN